MLATRDLQQYFLMSNATMSALKVAGIPVFPDAGEHPDKAMMRSMIVKAVEETAAEGHQTAEEIRVHALRRLIRCTSF